MKLPRLPQAIDHQELVVLTRQLATLVLSGTGLERSLSTLHDQAQDPTLKEAFGDLRDKVTSGHMLSQAATRWPRIFGPFYVAMLRTGESTGQLDEALERLSKTLEKDLAVRHKVRSAMVYPGFVLGLTVILTLTVFYTVIPGFVDIFKSSGTQLPVATQILIFISDAIVSPGTWLVVAAILIELGWIYNWIQKDPQRQFRYWELLQALPVLGPILQSSATCRFCASMETLINCGMTLDRSLIVAGEATGNPLFKRTVKEAVEHLRHGVPLSTHMATHPETYPSLLVQMVQTGEETSCLDAMFARVGDSLELDLDNQINMLSSSLEPLLLMFVAGIVAFIVLSIFLPLYGTLNTVM